MVRKQIDINCDVGEGVGNEPSLFPLLSSCNIACGGHAGNQESMDAVLQLAKEHRVKIGGHPSFPDVENFGRKVLPMKPEALLSSLQRQLEALCNRCAVAGVPLYHVKPHGALYNLAAVDKKTAVVVVDAVLELGNDVKLYAPMQSELAKSAEEAGVAVVKEAFADRRYDADVQLVSRSHHQALLTSPEAVFAQVLSIYERQLVQVISGEFKSLHADTYCFHSDTKEVVEVLHYTVAALANRNVYLAKNDEV